MPDFWLSPLVPTEEDANDVPGWRTLLRQSIFDSRLRASDLTGRRLFNGQVHEGLIPRAVVPSSVHWYWRIFAGPNCFLLREDEHIPQPPTRIECYWLSVGWYSKRIVDEWINSLPFKVPPPMPWRGTNGLRIIQSIRMNYPVTPTWNNRFFDPRVIKEVSCEG